MMAVKVRTTGEGFGRRTELALFDPRNRKADPLDNVDHMDTIEAHNAAQLWTLDGKLAAIENVAQSIKGFDEGGDDGSPANYAKRALKLVGIIRHEITAGNPDQVGRWAIELGSLWREFELKVEYEPAALTGQPIRRGLKEARERSNFRRKQASAEEHQLLQKAADKYFGRHPDASKNAAAEHAKGATKSALAVKTIAQRIKKPPKAQ